MWGWEFSLCYLQQQSEISQQFCEGMTIIIQESFHIIQCSNLYQTHTDNSLRKMFKSQNSQSSFVHRAKKQTNLYFVGEKKFTCIENSSDNTT
jgi:hypothetical protein